MGSLKRKLSRQRKQAFKKEVKKMETAKLKMVYDIRWTGESDDQGRMLRMERRNDPKYLLAILNGLDTNKDPFFEYRRTVTRLYDKLADLIRSWAQEANEFMKNNSQNKDTPDYILSEELEVSAETMMMLKKITEKDQPSDSRGDGKYRSIPVQSLLISLEDQHNDWYKKQTGEEDVSEDKTDLPPNPSL